jgi:hypothetical protein
MYSYTVIKCKYDPNILSRVSAEWITAKKDWKEAKQRHKAAQKLKGDHKFATIGFSASDRYNGSEDTGSYQHEMDEQRCILYLHGGMPPSICHRFLLNPYQVVTILEAWIKNDTVSNDLLEKSMGVFLVSFCGDVSS